MRSANINSIIVSIITTIRPRIADKNGNVMIKPTLNCIAIQGAAMIVLYFGFMQFFHFAQQDIDLLRSTRDLFHYLWLTSAIFFGISVAIVIMLLVALKTAISKHVAILRKSSDACND